MYLYAHEFSRKQTETNRVFTAKPALFMHAIEEKMFVYDFASKIILCIQLTLNIALLSRLCCSIPDHITKSNGNDKNVWCYLECV